MKDDSTWPRGFAFADEGLESPVWDQETGMPSASLTASAIQVWSALQNRRTSVRECATAFNLDDAQVREAVEVHGWMSLTGPADDPTKQFIEHDGE